MMELRKRETVAQAKEFSQKALGLLQSWNVPADPINYGVAYEIAKGNNKALLDTYHTFIQNGRTIDAYCLEQWQIDFLQSQQFEQNSLISGLDKILHELQTHVTQSGGSIEEFVNHVDSSMSALQQQADSGVTGKVIESLISASREVKGSHNQLQSQLELSQSEARTLRAELDKLQKQATTDALTGLLNRRGLEDYIAHVKQQQQSMTAIVLDIDHFKKFNDTFGHLIGDIVIAKVADQVKKSKPNGAEAVRYGGEEFVLLVPSDEAANIQSLAEKIRQRVSAMKLVNGKTKERLPQITISLGIAEQKGDEDFSSLIARADQALYKAKDAGRNQVQMAS